MEPTADELTDVVAESDRHRARELLDGNYDLEVWGHLELNDERDCPDTLLE